MTTTTYLSFEDWCAQRKVELLARHGITTQNPHLQIIELLEANGVDLTNHPWIRPTNPT